jgi:hypothetical protein
VLSTSLTSVMVPVTPASFPSFLHFELCHIEGESNVIGGEFLALRMEWAMKSPSRVSQYIWIRSSGLGL